MFYFKVTEPRIGTTSDLPTSNILLFMELDSFDLDGNPIKQERRLGGAIVHFQDPSYDKVKAVLETALADFKAHLTQEIQKAVIRPSPWMEKQP